MTSMPPAPATDTEARRGAGATVRTRTHTWAPPTSYTDGRLYAHATTTCAVFALPEGA
ncbi:hypothetical protein [Streptomyces sp. NPDC001450]